MTRSFLSVGHSTRSLEQFLEMLTHEGVTALADVRKLRGSRAHPHFNEEPLREALEAVRIAYVPCEALAGRRPKSPDAPEHLNGMWRNRSFHNYADYATTEPFARGVDGLIKLAGDGGTVAFMCAEAVWWRCHRRIIADHLLARGETVLHLMELGDAPAATLTDGAVINDDAAVTYPVG